MTATSAYLQPHVLDDWPALLAAARSNVRPDVHSPLSEADRDRLVEYTRRIGPLQTDDTLRVATAIDDLVETNMHAVNGSRRVLLIDGPSAMGKSQAAVSAILRASDRIWQEHGQRINGTAVIPYVYVEVGASGLGGALLRSIHDFCGLPVARREQADSMLARLRHLAPVLGIRAIVIDDAHMLRTVSAQSRRLTDFLKGMLTQLPVSLVFVGAGLRDSALVRQSPSVGYSAAEQIARRAQILKLKPWPHDTVGDRWTRLVANLESQLVLPVGRRHGVLTSSGTLRLLHQRSTGHPGLLIDWVKTAAVHALRNDVALTAEILRATAPPQHRPAA